MTRIIKKRSLFLLLVLMLSLHFGSTGHAAGPQIDGLAFKVYTSSDEALQSLLRGEVDMIQVDFTPEGLAGLRGNPNVRLVVIPDFGFTYIGMNLRYSPFNNPDFRQAMLYAFDREKALNDVLQGFGELLAAGLFSSAYGKLGWQNSAVATYSYDPERARQVLDSAGYTLSKRAEFRIDPSTNQPMSTLMIYSKLGNPVDVAIADAFARDMQAIGLPVLHLAQPLFDFETLMRAYNFDLFVDSVQATSAPTWLAGLFISSNDIAPVPLGSNLVGYRSEDFDRCAEEVVRSANLEDSRNAALECQALLADDLPVIPVFSKNLLITTSPSLSDVTPVVGSIVSTIRQTAINTRIKEGFGGELRVGLSSDFGDLDPASTGKPSDWLLLNLLVDPLITLDQDGKPAPGLAESWSATEGGKGLTFTLREGARFRTGEPITATDVAATIEWLMKTVRPSSPLSHVVGLIDRVAAPDPKTLRITLKQPSGFAINSIGQLFALPESRLMQVSGGVGFLQSHLLVSSGPFSLSELRAGEEARLTYNDRYYAAAADHKLPTKTIDASKGELLFGARVTSGTQVAIETKPMTFGGQPIENANLTVAVFDSKGMRVLSVPGAHKGQGIYEARFSADAPSPEIGTYLVEGQLYGMTPSGLFVVFEERTLNVRPATPLVLISLIVVIVVVFAVVILFVIRKRRLRS